MTTAAPGLSGRRVLVTGAAGFIGAALSRRLLEAGARVTGVDCLSPYYDVGLKRDRLRGLLALPGFAFHELDLTRRDATMALWREARPEAVVHLAAQAGVRLSLEDPGAYTQANVEGFLTVLEACRHHAAPGTHLLYASSSSVYGANTKVPFSERDPVERPVSLYAATKRADELMAQTYAHLFRIPCTGLRFFTVYGPWGRPDMAYYRFARAIFEGRPIELYGHGEVSRDFTYVDEVVEAMARLLEAPPPPDQGTAEEPGRVAPDVPHRIFNIGNHTPVRVGRFVDILEGLIGRRAERRLVPMQPGDVATTYADVSALAATVGFAPRTPLEDGLARFVAWYRDYHRPG